MAANRSFDARLHEIDALGRGEPSSATAAALTKALADKNNYIVAKAADAVARLGFVSLCEPLAAAFDRFLTNAAKSDPQCWAKNAIAKALRELSHADPDVFLKGASHVQMEPVWGGQADSAITLRSICALALVQTTLTRRDLLCKLVDLAADAEKQVRVDAVRAIAQLTEPEGVLLVRMKALAGDAESEVVGQCLTELLEISASEFVPFVKRFFTHKDEDLRLEALHALGGCRDPLAEDALVEAVGAHEVALGSAAVAVLGASRRREEVRERVEAAVMQRMSPLLRQKFVEHFGSPPLG